MAGLRLVPRDATWQDEVEQGYVEQYLGFLQARRLCFLYDSRLHSLRAFRKALPEDSSDSYFCGDRLRMTDPYLPQIRDYQIWMVSIDLLFLVRWKLPPTILGFWVTIVDTNPCQPLRSTSPPGWRLEVLEAPKKGHLELHPVEASTLAPAKVELSSNTIATWKMMVGWLIGWLMLVGMLVDWC